MDPIYELDTKSFIISDEVYYRSKNFLIKFMETGIMFPRMRVETDYISLEWPTCALHLYEDRVVLCGSRIKDINYYIPEDTEILLDTLDGLVPFRRSMPVTIPIR